MAKISVILDLLHPKKNGNCAIYVATSVKSKPMWFPTKVSVNPKEWDEKKQSIKGNTQQVKDDNLIIGNVKARVNNIFVKYRLNFEELTPELLKKEYENPTSDIDFYAFFKMHIEGKKDKIAESTYNQYIGTLNKLKRYKAKLAFSELDEDFISDFERHCKTKLDNNQNTINKNLKHIIEVIKKAKKKNKLQNDLEIKLNTQYPEITFLEPLELKKIIKKYVNGEIPKRYIPTTKRYLFSCYTGLRISDSLSLRYSNKFGNNIVVMAQKTRRKRKMVTIPLIKIALSLMEKSGDKNDLIFPKRAEQTINKDLKKIAEICKIDKKIDFKSARHTFATMYYRTTKNILGLQELLGHSDLRQTMVYTHVIPTDTEKEMKALNKTMEKLAA